MSPTPEPAEDLARLSVERAIAELRMGRAVAVEMQEAAVLVQSVEDLDADKASRLDAAALSPGRLVLPGPRLRRLGVERRDGGTIALPSVDAMRVHALAFDLDARIDAPVGPISPADEAALELARLALAMPAVVVVPVSAASLDVSLLRVAASALMGYRGTQVRRLAIVGRAPVPLDGAADTEFVVFRGGEGLRDQVAVVIGHPDVVGAVTVRMHSACLTGDLFGSLKCDCGDQLRGSVRWMSENGGGILLYLDQEGRGNGIANKIRAYRLQSLGYDTYDADEMLGFGPDQRRFDFAAEMLRQLGVAEVRLITNNPDKIEALARAGLAVTHQPAPARTTPENLRYLATKRDRAGHTIELDATGTGGGE